MGNKNNMLDKRVLADDLRETFINYQHRLDCPMSSKTETKASVILKYRNNPVFHAKVESLVAAVMYIINKHA